MTDKLIFTVSVSSPVITTIFFILQKYMPKKKESLITLKSHQQILRLISINFPQIHTLAFDSKH